MAAMGPRQVPPKEREEFTVSRHLVRSPAVLMAAGLLASSCSGDISVQACEQAALNQTIAEQAWQEELEQHVLADETLAGNPESSSALGDHDHSAEALFSARVNMILAEAETRRECN